MRFLPMTQWIFFAGLTLEMAGAVFAVWARLALGGNWSGRPSLMAGHELITSGPYAVARHPIYTGLILAVAGTALAIGEWRCLLSVFVIFLAFLMKIDEEERLMMQAFPETYPGYRQRVKALIPGVF
jgi:protein-S-isoprenylcysteine O-methyltransferase Ste14